MANLALPGTALTAREREVALLVAEGLTDRAIASCLRVSERTVHAHLRSAYAKTRTGCRVRLAAWMAGQEAGNVTGVRGARLTLGRHFRPGHKCAEPGHAQGRAHGRAGRRDEPQHRPEHVARQPPRRGCGGHQGVSGKDQRGRRLAVGQAPRGDVRPCRRDRLLQACLRRAAPVQARRGVVPGLSAPVPEQRLLSVKRAGPRGRSDRSGAARRPRSRRT